MPTPIMNWAIFSLARAYMDGGLLAEAVPELQRIIALNRNFSKAYALLGQAQDLLGQKQYAIETLTQGYRIAQEHRRSDAAQ